MGSGLPTYTSGPRTRHPPFPSPGEPRRPVSGRRGTRTDPSSHLPATPKRSLTGTGPGRREERRSGSLAHGSGRDGLSITSRGTRWWGLIVSSGPQEGGAPGPTPSPARPWAPRRLGDASDEESLYRGPTVVSPPPRTPSVRGSLRPCRSAPVLHPRRSDRDTSRTPVTRTSGWYPERQRESTAGRGYPTGTYTVSLLRDLSHSLW